MVNCLFPQAWFLFQVGIPIRQLLVSVLNPLLDQAQCLGWHHYLLRHLPILGLINPHLLVLCLRVVFRSDHFPRDLVNQNVSIIWKQEIVNTDPLVNIIIRQKWLHQKLMSSSIPSVFLFVQVHHLAFIIRNTECASSELLANLIILWEHWVSVHLLLPLPICLLLLILLDQQVVL